MITEWKAPLLEHLIDFSKQQPLSLHVPGHRNGNVYKQLAKVLQHTAYNELIEHMANLAAIDVTELSHTDDLHQPEGVIKQAQDAAAKLYGADQSYFLVGGSTAGNLALILSICNDNDVIIVQRNVHKSVINGCKLAGAKVVFLTPEIEPTTELPVIPSIETLEQALMTYPNAKAVFLTNPNYYGISAELTPYAELVHHYHIPLLVDEAHGAHYGIAPHTSRSALASGADAVVQSAHKTLPAFTMGAMLHVQGSYLSQERLQQQLSIIESSSPSYVLMATIDVARATLETYGMIWFQQTYNYIEHLTSWLKEKQLHIQSELIELGIMPYRQDPYRMLLYDASNTLSGFELQAQLESKGIWIEMATEKYAVLVWHMNMKEQQYLQLQQALQQISAEIDVTNIQKKRVSTIINSKRVLVSDPIKFSRYPSERKVELVPIQDAKGKCSADVIIPYPPGIPLLYEEELIQTSHIEQLQQFITLGSRFQGSTTISSGLLKVFV